MIGRKKKAAADRDGEGAREGNVSVDGQTADQSGARPVKRGRRPVFLPLVLSVMLVLLGIYLAIHLGLVSTRFMSELNQPKPPLADADPALGPGPRRLARHGPPLPRLALPRPDARGARQLDA